MDLKRLYRPSSIPEHARRVFEGEIFDVYQWDQEVYDGTTVIFERIARPDTVVVIPIIDDEKILLIRDTQPTRGTVVTPPAGKVEEGELPEDAAHRELLEETGYAPDSLTLWYSEQPTSKIDWIVYVYLAKGCKKIAEATPDAGEKIELLPVSFDALVERAVAGDIRERGLVERILRAKLTPDRLVELKNFFFH